ncbi:MAG: alpha/beta fold hydrolase [Phenylobacterium sp.]|uniref:alpha/beta fold hydrolase n=1 Tax=Phenylobacterium sp. TaxID=1871053 RepID=UPI0025CF0F1E|nr:alpha/beta fold hydrolase [Phenylobacterium sp.]MCG9915604.1 alpha/beta fold hydrolase [Phenylobacterium sp.]
MAYVDAGPRDARETLLLLHGQPMWGYLYRKMIGPFVEAGYRLIVLDLIGFGRSDKYVDPARYTYSAYVGWVTALVRKLDLQHVTIFGQDWCGLIGGRVQAEYIERFARAVMSNTALPGRGMMAIPGLTRQEPLTPEQLAERFDKLKWHLLQKGLRVRDPRGGRRQRLDRAGGP